MMQSGRRCTECGTWFTPRDDRQFACCAECQYSRKIRVARERYRRERKKAPPKELEQKPAQPTDWKAITRICAEHHISYGEAVRKGLI
ncbi:hypothetical protein SDC9_182628 [bioreactor metagenome]|uniref:Uncharacterized protein n=1 Tax=bioreactor metagenome TaxID=1076179 RepID=A0A645HHI8_9ZZZZ